ncbi:hypothetical protein M9458_003342, partial [Cirrhinus mrigala]
PDEDVYPGRRLSHRVWSVTAPESRQCSLAAETLQTQTQTEDHKPEQCGCAADASRPADRTLQRRRPRRHQ